MGFYFGTTVIPPPEIRFFFGGYFCHRDLVPEGQAIKLSYFCLGFTVVFHGGIVQIPNGNSDEIQKAEITSSETHRSDFHEIYESCLLSKKNQGPWNWLKIFLPYLIV